MKRPCFALTMLMAALAGSLAAVGTANSQTGLDPAHGGSWPHCPFVPTESSGSIGLCDDEDARLQAHRIEERYNELYNYDSPWGESTQKPTPAVWPETTVERESANVESPASPATEFEPDHNYRSGYDGGYDTEVYRPETTEVPAEPTSESVELDPYWTENKLPADVTHDADPYWYSTNNEPKHDTNDELDPYWTENKMPADVTEELDQYWTENKLPDELPGEETTIDPEWTRGAVEAVENWIEKLKSRPDYEPSVEPKQETIETEPVPVVEPKYEQPVENADPIYGPHIWDDCDLGHKSRHNCERPTPEVTNYAEEPTPARNHSFNAVEHRQMLRSVAHLLNEASEALQTASQNLSRIADGTEDDASRYNGYEFDNEYRD